ncbi:MAG: ABC transporter permease [Mesorhizobium sp.]
MQSFILRRLVSTLFLLAGVLVMTFALARILPGDPARLIAGARAGPEAVADVRAQLGLDLPLVQQFVHYVSGILHGDFGRSIITRRPISQDILTFFPATCELVILASFISLIGGVALGTAAAVNSSGKTDAAVRVISVFGLSVPDFWMALIAQLLFFSVLGVLPFGGRLATGIAMPPYVTGFLSVDSLLAGRLDLFADALRHMILPIIVLAIPSMAVIIRVVRTTMLDVLSADYIRTARAKGIAPLKVYLRHALANSLLPIVTVFGLNMGLLISGAVLVELIFNLPGLGRYTADAISGSDYNAIMAITLVVSAAYIVINLAVDLSYVFLDPRVELK